MPATAPADRQQDRANAFVHVLTAIHGLGAIVTWGMAAYVLVAGDGDALATTPGARQLVDWAGDGLAAFFLVIGAFLAALAWGSLRRQRWSWPAALAAYLVGVGGSVAEVLLGHGRYTVSLAVNAAVVAMLLLPGVRAAFGWTGEAA